MAQSYWAYPVQTAVEDGAGSVSWTIFNTRTALPLCVSLFGSNQLECHDAVLVITRCNSRLLHILAASSSRNANTQSALRVKTEVFAIRTKGGERERGELYTRTVEKDEHMELCGDGAQAYKRYPFVRRQFLKSAGAQSNRRVSITLLSLFRF